MIVNPCGHISPVRAVLGAGYILVWVNGFMGLVGNSVERGDNSPSCREKKKTTQGGRSVVHQETVKRLVVVALVYRSAIAGSSFFNAVVSTRWEVTVMYERENTSTVIFS